HALRVVRDVLAVGPLGRLDAPAQIRECRVRDGMHRKRTNVGGSYTRLRCGLSHNVGPPTSSEKTERPPDASFGRYTEEMTAGPPSHEVAHQSIARLCRGVMYRPRTTAGKPRAKRPKITESVVQRE